MGFKLMKDCKQFLGLSTPHQKHRKLHL